ncbi:hypothetical protein D3C87_1504470 [compost metagenome]
MVLHAIEEHLVGDAIVQVFAGVNFVADVDARLVEGVEDRRPAAGQLVEGLFDQPSRALWPGVEIGPGQRARKGRMRV